ncbi:hypothetical protein FQN54_008845 [Arachnomyces sp. PD_36]|nr:hypothetical protein FQN54_008845 [Arachnomyces sp. PD_36]
MSSWLPALEDTEKTLKAFFSSCIEGGPSLCALANFNGPNTTTTDLLDAFNDALQALLDDPIISPPLLAASAWNPTPATTLYTAIKATIFASIYHATQYPGLAMSLEPILAQNFTGFLDAVPELPPTDPNNPPELPYNYAKVDSFWGVACSDSSYRASSPEEMESVVRAQQHVSGMDDAFIGKTWPCAQWKLEAVERFLGPFSGETSFPILFVNGEYDPATPIRSAFAASAAFKGSTVLTHGGQGHKFMRHPSICTAKAVKAYFLNGTMPEGGTYCPPDVSAFEVAGNGGEGPGDENPHISKRGLSEDDSRLLSRMLEFGPLDVGMGGF